MSVTITELTELAVAPATTDVVPIVDVSDSTQSPQGSTKKITVASLFTTPAITGATTVSGLLTASGGVKITGGVFATGVIWKDATYGLSLAGIVGATPNSDFSVFSPSGASQIIGVPTGTSNVIFAGSLNAVSLVLSAGLDVGTSTGDFTIRTNKFIVVGASGNTTVAGTLTVASNYAGAGGITSSAPTGTGIGYATGAGGTATQTTNRVTAVTVDKLCGSITTDNSLLAAQTSAVFTVNNSTVAIGDVPLLAIRSGRVGANTAVYVSTVAAGSFQITVANNHLTDNETGAIIINFTIMKGVTA